MQRKEIAYLVEWASRAKHKPIVIRGARQVGKSTLVRLVAEKLNFKLYEINFERFPELGELFNSNEPKEILKLLAAQNNQSIVPGKTLLFLDEIQAAPNVLQVLRYFYEDMPDLHVIAAGSLLEFTLNNMPVPMPVGRIEYLHMGPMSFEDFLVALQESAVLDFLVNYNLGMQFPIALHNKLTKLLKAYLIVGGMPEAIAYYVENLDFIATERVKQSILSTYKSDFSKYADPHLQDIIRKIFNTLPRLIGNKFKYSNISHDYKSVVIATALEKLCLAKVAFKVNHTASNGIPLGAEINEKIFKVIFLDVGLLATSVDLNFSNLLQTDDITMINAGAIAEQFIGQHLLYSRPIYEEPKLYYWVREQKSAASELDYVMSMGQNIIPVEVKAGKTGTLKSLHYFMREKNLSFAVRFNADLPSITAETTGISGGTVLDYRLLSLPLYMVGQLPRLLQHFMGAFSG